MNKLLTPTNIAILFLVFVWAVIMPILSFFIPNTVVVNHKNPPGLGSYYEIGWSTVVGDQIINYEPESGTHYVVVYFSNQINNLRRLHICHINMSRGERVSINDMVWYDDSTTPPTPKVYVIGYRDFQRGITDTYYVKWNAALPAINLVPKNDKK